MFCTYLVNVDRLESELSQTLTAIHVGFALASYTGTLVACPVLIVHVECWMAVVDGG